MRNQLIILLGRLLLVVAVVTVVVYLMATPCPDPSLCN